MAKLLTFPMRTALASLCVALTVSSAFAQTSPRLSNETAARLAPNDNAAILRILPAGSQLRPASAAAELLPQWQAITLDGPFTLYVRNGDIDKGLAIKPASPLYLEPDNAAAVVAYAEEGDAITITGLRGRWTQVELQKPLTSYVSSQADNAPATTANTATNRATDDAAATTPRQATQSASVSTVTGSTEPAAIELPETETPAALTLPDFEMPPMTAQPAIAHESDSSAAHPAVLRAPPPLNRTQIQGKLVSTRRRFSARRPYDWQINAKPRFRIAYLDFSRMQGTDQLARYEGQQVVVYGLVSPLGDGQYVVQVESIRLQ